MAINFTLLLLNYEKNFLKSLWFFFSEKFSIFHLKKKLKKKRVSIEKNPHLLFEIYDYLFKKKLNFPLEFQKKIFFFR